MSYWSVLTVSPADSMTATAPTEIDCPVCNDRCPEERDHQDGDVIEHIYHDHDYTQHGLADLFDRPRSHIKRWFDEYDIEASQYDYEFHEDELRRLYEEERMSMQAIADHYGCSQSTVRNKLKGFGIELRGPSKTNLDRDADADMRYREKEYLEKWHSEGGLSPRDIADKCDVSPSAVRYWMKKRDIRIESDALAAKSYETDRGEFVRSIPEREIANWLHSRGIDYTYEPDLEEVRMIPDFLVNGYYIEYWGMVTWDEYREQMEKKKQKYDEIGADRVDIYPEDRETISDKLNSII